MKDRHSITVDEATPGQHQVGVKRVLFIPVCSCGWEGAWMYTKASAHEEGRHHQRLMLGTGS